MKRAHLSAVVHKHGHRIIAYGEQLPGAFDEEAIHDLRVEYKKLRAFVRLVQATGKKAADLAMPHQLKLLYQAAGKVRDLQLFLQQVTDHIQQRTVELPALLQQLKRQLFQAKEALVEAWEALKRNKTIARLTRELPRKLDGDAINAFIHRKVAAVQFILMALEEDGELHSIRKQLKDILLNVRIFNKDFGKAFPIVAWHSEQRLEETTELLGKYNDICTTLLHLNDHSRRALPVPETTIVQQWKEHLLHEKEVFRNKVIDYVHQLRLVSNFEVQN